MLTLQLRATEVLDDLLPVRRVVVAAKVRFELAAENLQGSTLANTVGTDQTQDAARAGHGKTMKLETVGCIAVGNHALKVGRQIDNGNGAERAPLRADTTTNAELLRDEGDA